MDGRLGAHGDVHAGRLIQAKGVDYSAEALLGSADWARRFQNGSFATLYLSPRDYHRIHTPTSGTVLETRHEPGTLWPVNPPAVRRIPQLFAVNERVSCLLATEQGAIAVVLVGATNVGSIRLAYSDFVSNRGRARRQPPPPVEPHLARGAHLATFELGSTVILLTEQRVHWRDPSGASWEEGRWFAYGSPLAVVGTAEE